ncbi:MAG: hypothetical protein ACI9WT_001514 [Flavobacterium sp.]|jgi:hypothetical protein
MIIMISESQCRGSKPILSVLQAISLFSFETISTQERIQLTILWGLMDDSIEPAIGLGTNISRQSRPSRFTHSELYLLTNKALSQDATKNHLISKIKSVPL